MKEKLKKGIKNSLLDPEEGYLEVLAIDPGDEDALRGLVSLYEIEEPHTSGLISSLHKQLMDFHSQQWRYFHQEANRQKRSKNYSEAIGYFELAFKKLVLCWHDLKTVMLPAKGPLHKTEAYRTIDAAITSIRQDIESITKDILPVIEKPYQHLKEHLYIQQLLESEGSITPVLLEKLLTASEHVERALIGVVRGWEHPFFTPGREHVVLNAVKLLGEKRSKGGIPYLVNILRTSHPLIKRESMIALAKLSQKHSDMVMSRLKTVVYEDCPIGVLLAVIETIGWIDKQAETIGFLRDMVKHIALFPQEHRGDILEFICGAMSAILGQEAAPFIKRVCIDCGQWITHKDIQNLPQLKCASHKSNRVGILSESIYRKCCRKPTKWEALKSITATYVWDIYRDIGKRSLHSCYTLATMFSDIL